MKSNRPLYVLIVDDEDAFRQVLGAVIMKSGFDIEECNSGEGALVALKQFRFDVVVLDYKMEGLNGIQVLQWMDEQKIDTPVIMLSGAGSENVGLEAMRFGAYDFIRKELFDQQHFPFLIRGVHERHLYKKSREQENAEARGAEKNLASIQLLRDTSRFLAHQVNTILADIQQEMSESEQRLRGVLPDNSRALIEKSFSDIRNGLSIIAVVTKSLVDLARLLYEQLQGGPETKEAEDSIRDRINALKNTPSSPS